MRSLWCSLVEFLSSVAQQKVYWYRIFERDKCDLLYHEIQSTFPCLSSLMMMDNTDVQLFLHLGLAKQRRYMDRIVEFPDCHCLEKIIFRGKWSISKQQNLILIIRGTFIIALEFGHTYANNACCDLETIKTRNLWCSKATDIFIIDAFCRWSWELIYIFRYDC